MVLILDHARSHKIPAMQGGDGLTIGLVNNMPDAAFEATERQFLDLVRAAAPEGRIRCKLFVTPEVARARKTRQALGQRYRDVDELWNAQLDGLIVTGAEPRAEKLADEPYWPTMTRLGDWARDNTLSTIWSCLAAHAVVLYADRIGRVRLAEKLSGVFACETVEPHPLMAGVVPLGVPHSRYNDLPAAALVAAGYQLLSQSAVAGVDAFARDEQGGSLFVFFQGHPEYDADSLLREYRRDIGLYLRGAREHYPAAPQNYFSRYGGTLLEVFRTRAIADRYLDLAQEFQFAAVAAGIDGTWRRSARRFYRNWIEHIRQRKDERMHASVSLRRQHRDAGLVTAGRRH
ncbi:MAG TPA: homoserine O-succinyltransferase [Xanthobacteraceae bacterium]|nr:homoserine O-succinyltransferase [Xanthobacteraceae bacterium]